MLPLTHDRSASVQTWRRFVPSRLERDDPFPERLGDGQHSDEMPLDSPSATRSVRLFWSWLGEFPHSHSGG